MRVVKLFLAAALLLSVSQKASAQIRLGGYAGFLHLFGGTGINTMGLGITGEYGSSDRVSYHGGIGYYFPATITDYTYGYAMSNQTSPSQIEIPIEQKISFINAFVGAKYYLVGEFEDDFGLYGLGEAGLIVAPAKTTVGTYDESLYYTTTDNNESTTLSNFTVNIGLGTEFNIGVGFLFADLKFNIPAVQYNSRTGASGLEIPGSLGMNAGFKIPLD